MSGPCRGADVRRSTSVCRRAVRTRASCGQSRLHGKAPPTQRAGPPGCKRKFHSMRHEVARAKPPVALDAAGLDECHLHQPVAILRTTKVTSSTARVFPAECREPVTERLGDFRRGFAGRFANHI